MADRLLLVVEGKDDKHVIWGLLKARTFEPHFKIRVASTEGQPLDEEGEGGYETLLQEIPQYLKLAPDLERFGIVVDADADLAARWQSLKGVLTRAGYTDLPSIPDPAGTVIDQEFLPRLGIWIMPNNELPGMLEDYMAFLVPANDALLGRARQCLDAIPEEDRRFAEVHRPKALIHTWLAWQEDPGTPLGLAITKRYFDPETPHATAFVEWLSRLFAG